MPPSRPFHRASSSRTTPRRPDRAVRNRHGVVAALCLVAAVVVGAASCSTKDAAGGAKVRLGSGRADTRGVTLQVGDQNQLIKSAFAASGALDGAPYKVVFNQFTDGPHMSAAFSANRIDVGWLGDTPAIYANAARAKVTLLSASRTGGSSGVYTLLTRPGSNIHSIADLKGKKVALTKRTALEGWVVKLLATKGLTERDIHPVDLPILSIVSALSSGQVDAAVGVPPSASTFAQAHPESVVKTPTVPLHLVVLGNTRSLDDGPKEAALEDFVARLVKAETWIASHRSRFVQSYYVDTLKVPPSIGQQLYGITSVLSVAPIRGSGLRPNLEAQYKAFVSLGALPADPPIADLFDPGVIARFDAIVTRSLHDKVAP